MSENPSFCTFILRQDFFILLNAQRNWSQSSQNWNLEAWCWSPSSLTAPALEDFTAIFKWVGRVMNLSNPVGGAVWCHSGAAQKKAVLPLESYQCSKNWGRKEIRRSSWIGFSLTATFSNLVCDSGVFLLLSLFYFYLFLNLVIFIFLWIHFALSLYILHKRKGTKCYKYDPN